VWVVGPKIASLHHVKVAITLPFVEVDGL